MGEGAPQDAHVLLTLMNSLTLNFYVRSKISTGVSVHDLYELPIPQLTAAQKKKLADFAAKLLKNPRHLRERAALEVFIARELYGLSLDDWKHFTGTFTFGSGATKEELDEIIRQSLKLWDRPSFEDWRRLKPAATFNAWPTNSSKFAATSP